MLIKINNTLDDFLLTKSSSNEAEIYDSLVRIQPNKLSLGELIELIRYVEHSYKRPIISKHYNSFGTGGDKLKTINISTMASIIASNFINVWKVGTGAVTSKWGSSDFVNRLYSLQKSALLPDLNNKITYKIGSGYIALKDFGWQYSEALRDARRRIYSDGILDIYKVVFPSTNLTGSYGQVNGISKLDYLDFFINISIALDRNSVIVNSPIHNNDEMISGKNLITRILNDKIVNCEIVIPGINNQKYDDFIHESDDLNEHISRFIKIIKGECETDVVWTIAYNAACILNLEYQDLLLESLAEKVFQYITLKDR